WNVAGIPSFDGCSADRVVVDFGRSGDSPSNDLPKGIVLGRFTDLACDVSGWSVANTGYAKVGGRFAVAPDGTLSVDLERKGLTLIVR
ncbi:MAG: hypothetical protein IJV85_04505, partial [Clostridia bacterium]|nr:hypothetical protein [Clostridia bacterium]